MLIFRGVVYIIHHHTTIWFDLKFAISIWHDMQRPKFFAATPAKLKKKRCVLGAFSWLGSQMSCFRLFFPQSSFQTQEHMCICGCIDDLQTSHFMLGSGGQILCPACTLKFRHRMFQWNPTPNTWPAPCSMGGSSNCLPGNAWIQWETALFWGEQEFSEYPSKAWHLQMWFLYIPANTVIASESRLGYHRIQR